MGRKKLKKALTPSDNIYKIFANRINDYLNWLEECERSKRTIATYHSCLKNVIKYVNSNKAPVINKAVLTQYKNELECNYKIRTANVYVGIINRYIKHLKLHEHCIKPIKIQQAMGIDNILELDEYTRLIDYTKNQSNAKTYLIIRTLASTGMRVGELKFITVESLTSGIALVKNKNKFREVIISNHIIAELLDYCNDAGISSGVIFNLHPSSIWRRIQASAAQVGICKTKAHPHNLRHLFAKTYLNKTKNIASLAETLGHVNINTTLIYTRETNAERREKIESLEL